MRGTSAAFALTTATPVSRYYRVRAVNDCDGSRSGWSAPVRVAIMPAAGASRETHVVVPHGTRQPLETTVTVKVDPGATSFVATPSEPWRSCRPSRRRAATS